MSLLIVVCCEVETDLPSRGVVRILVCQMYVIRKTSTRVYLDSRGLLSCEKE